MTDFQLKWSDITKELKKCRYQLFQLLNYNNFYLAVGSLCFSCWQLSVGSVGDHQVTVWIEGLSIALHDRFIRLD